MSYRFDYQVTPAATELRMGSPGGILPADSWSIEAPASLLPGVDLAQRLIAAGAAISEDDTVFIEHRAVSSLSVSEAKSLGLPPISDVAAHLETTGIIGRPEFRIKLSWRRGGWQPIIGTKRTGAWLRIGNDWHRLPDVLFEIAEGVDRLNALPDDDLGARLKAIASLREVLPAAISSASVETTGLIGEITIAVADAFSLDLVGSGNDAKLEPILHRAGGNPEDLLLSTDEQVAFGRDQFNRFGTARPVYALGNGKYLVLSPPLRKALAEVRRVQSSPIATKRALLASPRAFLRDALGMDTDETLIESVFRETSSYSERVIGLGLWQPRVLPWIKLGTTNWFGPEIDRVGGTQRQSASETAAGIVIGAETIALSEDQADQLKTRIENAIGADQKNVSIDIEGRTIDVPASYEALAALDALRKARSSLDSPNDIISASGKAAKPGPDKEALVIKPNEQEVQVEGNFAKRPAPPLGLPSGLASRLKQHQVEGLDWLQKAWASGRPGVLLADDMGLGKTFQSLAFLAWLRDGMASGAIERAPMLVVAPTGLLENWRAEHDRHLSVPGLGHCVQAYGRALADIRKVSSDGRPSVDVEALRKADWVLTTYETLRDYDLDFGQVRFSALLLDEAQKIKTPGVRVTDAAKAMNAEFRLAMTGTPVENRLADLWCITDAVHPACLGDLKTFSATYEKEPDLERLRLLKSFLDVWHGGRAPLLLRRLKEDKLSDLPRPVQRVSEAVMSGSQLAQYEATLDDARKINKPGAVLEILQRMRAISLHPDGNALMSDSDFITASARMRISFDALDSIASRRERVLVFLDDLDLQARMAGIVQRRYGMAAPPMIINGSVAGATRQARVDRFQVGPEEFDAMILSPRAGGVGLTLTQANHVIHLSRWWNPAVEDQCTGRVVRIGQTREVEVHIPISLLPQGRASFDQNLHALLERKRRLMRDALLPPNVTDADRNELFQATVN
ncbi:DEAD/DEAH box helicase [Bradyrhizobium sp. CW10]|uniref:DEAD/DEAH box helicase n=1 Tax=Bradyrhizobium sp. CW10 TaxID=2782683 RepID=UPI001FF7660C|nr:DEAD/DEAH box helicase [Bradyrhizobium sp. CW10]MCK1472840.1 DEAD/DEAH box helicase [Bradyrhizobium sp. CW10]